MIKKYLEIINELDNGNAERNPTFVNSVSQLAYDRHGMNAAAETQVQNALHNALDQYFN
jgi:hypothetical protein